jgi:hypothetical protein
MPENVSEPNTKYKVGTVLSSYDLLDLHAELPAMWLGEIGEAKSLRDLADEINIAILRRAMESAGTDPLEGEAANAYRLLTGDDVSAGVRTQQRNRLKREGVVVDELEDDFVTHQAVYTYLTKGLDISKDTTDDTDPLEKHEQRIQRLRSRTEAVTESSLSELDNAGEVTLGEFDTNVDIRIYCQDCQTQYDLTDLLHAGGCNCGE